MDLLQYLFIALCVMFNAAADRKLRKMIAMGTAEYHPIMSYRNRGVYHSGILDEGYHKGATTERDIVNELPHLQGHPGRSLLSGSRYSPYSNHWGSRYGYKAHQRIRNSYHRQSQLVYGRCDFVQEESDIRGSVDLRQKHPGMLEVRLNISGIPVSSGSGLHGFHVHTYGDLSDGCASTGGHYNPFNTPHGAPTTSPAHRHVGDFGNIESNSQGRVAAAFNDYLALLTGKHSIIGRAIVLHEGEDDLGLGGDEGSARTGNAGRRLGCCVIGWADDYHWEGV